MSASEESSRGCVSGCLGCGCASFLLVSFFTVALVVAAWFYQDSVEHWVREVAPGKVAGLAGDFIRSRSARPMELPPLSQSPEALGEVRDQVLSDWRSSEGAESRSLSLNEEQLNLFLRSMIRDPRASSVFKGVHDLYLKPGPGRLDVQGVFYGEQVAGLIPEQGLPPLIREILTGAEFLNVEVGARVLQLGEGGVRVLPDQLQVLGIPLPVSLLQDLALRAGLGGGKGGFSLPGVRRLNLSETGVQVEMDAGSWIEK